MEAECVPVFRHGAGHLRLPHGRLRHRVPHPRVAGEAIVVVGSNKLTLNITIQLTRAYGG